MRPSPGRSTRSLDQDKLFEPGDQALVVISHTGDTITNVTMIDHYRISWAPPAR